MILILTDPNVDVHSSAVSKELSKRGEKFLVYNPGSYPYSSTLSIEYENHNLKTTLSWDDSRIDLSEIKSVWYRRPGKFELSEKLSSQQSEWIRNECNHVFRSLWANLSNVFWISKPENIQRASLKLLQINIANEIGFDIPRLIVTNNPENARSFISSCTKGSVVKTLVTPYIIDGNRSSDLYTHLVTEEDEKELDSVRYGPTFLQECVPSTKNIRVTVIGRSVFGVSIDSSSLGEGKIDFRQCEIYDLEHKSIDLPKKIRDNCIKLVRQLGLNFGAIDLLMSPDEKYKFLEINPNGQWLWIEEMTGLPLTSCICDLLSSPSTTLRKETVFNKESNFLYGKGPIHNLQLGKTTLNLYPPVISDRSNKSTPSFSASRIWIEKKNNNHFIHFGDVDSVENKSNST